MRSSSFLGAAGVLVVSAVSFAQCPPQWLPGEGYATSATNGNVQALTVWDPDGPGPAVQVLVASASFPRPGQPPVGVAAWNGHAWQPLGQCPVPHPAALAVYNGELVAGGFGNGTATFPSIARWNGVSWLVLGGDVDSGVRALWAHGGDLYAGGEMTVAGGMSVNKIARWDGAQWHDVGGGVTGLFFPMVFSLHSFKGDLIAGGFFSAAGGTPANRIARWDGEQWHALGAGRPGTVDAIAVHQGELIAGGSLVGEAIARWDGESWNSLGAGVDEAVRALTVYKGDIIAGGFFLAAGGARASRLARWDGAAWGPLTTGVANMAFGAGQVDALAVFNGELISGGFFDVAGGLPSFSFGRWSDSGSPWISQQPQPQAAAAGGTLTLTTIAASGYSNLSYQWRRNGTPVSNGPGGASPAGGVVSGASGIAAGGTAISIAIAGVRTSDAGSYDLVITHTCSTIASDAAQVVVTGGCYANCDGSTVPPVLSGNDFQCFLNLFAAGDPRANCDGSAGQPVLTGNDFQCFLDAFAAGCG